VTSDAVTKLLVVDRAYPEAKLILEADGRRWHARAKAISNDHQRDFEAARAGWLMIRLLHEDLSSDPDDVALGLVETYRGRLTAAA
jgi:very-short-patch-repair endonuclease